jgi:hypothetical protein
MASQVSPTTSRILALAKRKSPQEISKKKKNKKKKKTEFREAPRSGSQDNQVPG